MSLSLFYAAKKGNVNAVKKLLNNEANVNQADNENGITPLIIASGLGRADIVKLLLAKGANVNKASKEGWTPLYEASINGRANVVKVLLNKGADVNKVDKFGKTPLHGASYLGRTEVVKVLLAAPGIDVNKADIDGRTPLYWASRDGYTGVVQALLAAPGIDVNKADKDGETPLYLASDRGHVKVVKLLLSKGANINKATESKDTPLLTASYKGHMEVVKLLLAKGADANKPDVDGGETALYVASEEDHAGIVEILLKAGANPNKADKRGRTPLYVASREGNPYSVRALLKSRVIQVDQADKDGWTPLMIASQFGSPLCARALLKAGANVNKTKPDGVTALHVASFNDKEDVVKELLAAKDIDPFKKNEDGKTALDDAKSDAVKKLLRKAMGITTRWRNMNANQRNAFKPMLLKRMIAKGFKNGKNATFTEPIIYANYSYRTLKPVNNKNKKITSFGLVIDDKNNVKSILDLEGATRAMRNVRERAIRENKTVKQPLPGIIFENWSLVNFTPEEYFNAMKDLMKLSAVAKSARTRKNLESGRMNRIEANQRKTARIANLRSTIRKSRRELNNLM
jgi:ankyrin repeat protein